VPTNTFFAGHGDVCGSRPNGDAVVRYDQLARRWLVVMPIFHRAVPASRPGEALAPVARPGDAANFPGQRFAARLATDPKGLLTFRESVLANGEAAQTTTLRWEDYTQTAMDPADDCTVWYVGDYLKAGAASYSTRIGAVQVPGCITR